MSWSQIAKLLLSAGSKAPQLIAVLMAAFQLFEQLLAKLGEAGPLLGIDLTPPAVPIIPSGPVALSVEDEEAKAVVLSMLKQHEGGVHAAAFGDGKFAERFGKFLQNPLVQQIIGLALQKLLAGS